ncbi:predicted protein [Plenodomus lingam JN3]|uniref:Predicted protein n=1 Tax=Leptosphaeria maculans (strain JN3 / isolate v23.1.3 / race Av1-4-5-6-7-8) TaxID=985895 RepID=E5A8V8_LEPMJ|nr:predicted protein [Plenodomus lingam JN3]CBY00053.1 predicted protein [Plenodomus lingam JN3]
MADTGFKRGTHAVNQFHTSISKSHESPSLNAFEGSGLAVFCSW